jgi:hypothetical protein
VTGRTTRSGYGWSHQKLRAGWAKLVELGAVTCSKCCERIKPGQKWDLAHAPVKGAHRAGLYAGPQHAECNRNTAGARKPPVRPRAPALAIFDPPPQKPYRASESVL